MGEFVKTEDKGYVRTIILNRPSALNALDTGLLQELSAAFEAAQQDGDVRVIIFTGEGRAFAAGGDIGEMAGLDMEEGRAHGKKGQTLFRSIEKSEKPTIAAVNGFALGGGCELAMACDIRIASENAVFGQPEVGLGITPGFSGTQRLPELVGKAKALELILTGDKINAPEAQRIGLVNQVVPAEALMERAMEMAEKISANAPLAVRWANSAVKRGLETDIDSGIDIEGDLFAMCFATEDQKEGMQAFLEHRKAVFKGK